MSNASANMPADLASKKAALGSAPADFFDPAFMALCGASYALPATIPSLVSAIPPWDRSGRWECLWGPALGDGQANLAFVAAYIDTNVDLPVCAALVIRGTDAGQTWGDFIEAVEDLDIGNQVSFPLANDESVKVAQGTLLGLGVIESLVDPSTNEQLPSFLGRYFSDPANQNPILVVTGHSLGGCLTTVVAPWAATVIPQNIPTKAVTFAAPTAGNPAFAAWYANTIRISNRYYNSLDVVPMAWNDLSKIKDSFSGGPSIPLLARAAVDSFQLVIDADRVTYEQTTPRGELTGNLCSTGNWYDEVFAQHNHLSYISLMAGGNTDCSVTRQTLRDMMATGDPKLVK